MIALYSHFTCRISAHSAAISYSRSRGTARVRTALVLGASACAALLATHGVAEAANGSLKVYAGEVSTKTNIIVDIVSYVCYLGGAVLSALGVVDLKKHVEQPTQTPLKNGLAKLGFGGILLALPFVSGIMQETMKSDAQATYVGFKNKPVIQ